MMSNLNKIIDTYQSAIISGKQELSSIRNKIYRIGSIRLLLFIFGISGIIYFWSESWIIISGTILLTFLPFLFLIKYHNQLFYKKNYIEKRIEINENELAAINYDLSAFDGGNEYIDTSHLYTYDLDIFGYNSLFQYVNRTSTIFGKKQLAEWFIKHLDKKKEIEERQKAIHELASDLEFRQEFRILGLLYKGKTTDGENIAQWINTKCLYRNKTIFKILKYMAPITTIVLLILGILGILSFTWLGFSFTFFVITNFSIQKSISQIQATYGRKLKILSTYATLMELTEKKSSNSAIIRYIQKELKDHKGVPASQAIKQLSKEMNILDQRNNVLVSTVLNGFLLWELHQIIKIETWKEQHANYLLSWLNALGKMDALCSLSTFAYNHPEYIYPQIISTPFKLEAQDMGHPLMHREKCIKNNINIPERPFFVIITGANMAGKSTYLRTIGVNYLLACMGAPVCCKQMKIYPAHLITSLRTTDSLTENESYFFAELKRLKLIIEKLNAGEELFIILDEILKGTNSLDKQKGSIALIKQLMELNTNGIIATHDLMLGNLSTYFPQNIQNFRFEADIRNDELTFSYQLKPGIAQNMNACFLMKKMGIVVTD